MDPLREIRIMLDGRIKRVTNRRCDNVHDEDMEQIEQLEREAELRERARQLEAEVERQSRINEYQARLDTLVALRELTARELPERFDSSKEDLPDEDF